MADKTSKNKKEKTRISDACEREQESSQSSSKEEIRKKEKKVGKRKSRKRSHSESSTNNSSSSSSECDKRKPEKKVKKRKKRSTSSSSSESGHDRSKARNKQHKRKKKKDKKLKKKKKEKKSKKHGAVDQNHYGAYGVLRESDLFVKQQEFFCWMQEVKNINPETLTKFDTRKMFETFMEDYNTATLPHKKYYDLEKWEAKRQEKNELKALKKARDTSFCIADDEKRHDQLHRRAATGNKYAGPSRQELLAMQQELRRRQDEEYKKKAGLA